MYTTRTCITCANSLDTAHSLGLLLQVGAVVVVYQKLLHSEHLLQPANLEPTVHASLSSCFFSWQVPAKKTTQSSMCAGEIIFYLEPPPNYLQNFNLCFRTESSVGGTTQSTSKCYHQWRMGLKRRRNS